MRSIRCLVFGVGNVGREAIGALIAEGVEILGVYSRSNAIGEDVGEFMGGNKTGVKIKNVSDFEASSVSADIALFFTTSSLEDILGVPCDCLRAGINVLTIAEEALYPWAFAPDTAKRIDKIAKSAGVTISSCGINDAAFVHLPAMIASFAKKPSLLKISCLADFTKFGDAGDLPFGFTLKEFEEFSNAIDINKSITRNSLEALSSVFGEANPDICTKILPYYHSRPALNKNKAQLLTNGYREQSTALLSSGLALQIILTGTSLAEGEFEELVIEVDGDDGFINRLAPFVGGEMTVAMAISRISDVINAPAGYITIDNLNGPRYAVNRFKV